MIYYIIFALLSFLLLLNGYLRGRRKQHIDAVLGVALVAVVVAGTYSQGWIALAYFLGIGVLGGNFVMNPLAKAAARRLLSS